MADVVIGDRSCGEWRHACGQALNFARLLRKKVPAINLSDVLAIFATRDDVMSVWERGGNSKDVGSCHHKALALEIDGAERRGQRIRAAPLPEWSHCATA